MKKLGDIVLGLAIIVVVMSLADLVGLTQVFPKGFGVTPGGYLRFAIALTLLNIAISLREKK
jgi:hypothetical protein